ncbi:MAG: PCRF domain-containing protein, partial [Bacteroidaceae bacterium]|nr:PCRF domain-containing protein [Bacteroidaceae bacterium]
MSHNSLLNRLKDLQLRFEEVGTLITDPSVIADQRRYVKLTKEYSDLDKINKATIRYEGLLNNISEAREILETE